MKKITCIFLGWFFALILVQSAMAEKAIADKGKKLRIGVTLHPYFSYTSNITGDLAQVVPLIKEGFNPHGYRPQPDDIKRAMTLDVLVLNGVGHDEFAFEILDAAGMKDKIPLIYANSGVSLIPVGGALNGLKTVNSHTFISITASIQQIYTICKNLEKIDPENAGQYRKNTRRYAKKLRLMKAEYMKKIADLPELDFRCATIHGGYDYLLQEFGLQVTAVIEPGHGLKPTASQLAKTIDKIKTLGVDVIFTEMNFPDKYIDTIQAETGVRVRYLSHLSSGKYSKQSFEEGIRKNMEALTNALIEVHSALRTEKHGPEKL